MVGRSKSRKRPPSFVSWWYKDDQVKKIIAFIFLRSTLSFHSPSFTSSGTKEATSTGRKLRSRESILAEKYVPTRRSHQTFKDKGRGGRANASFSLNLLTEARLEWHSSRPVALGTPCATGGITVMLAWWSTQYVSWEVRTILRSTTRAHMTSFSPSTDHSCVGKARNPFL